jgi:hypothetical protein
MLRENATLPPAARLSVRAMYERIRDQDGFRGSYGAVKDYVRPIARDEGCIWEYVYDLLVSLDKKRAVDFLFCLSRADPPVISSTRTERFFRDFGRITITPLKSDKREQTKRGVRVDACAPSERDRRRGVASRARRHARTRVLTTASL